MYGDRPLTPVMKLRHKTLLLISTTLIGLISILYIAASKILLTSFAQLEETDTRENVGRAVDAFTDDINKLNYTVRDWAEWDDTYKFVQDGNQTYRQTNLENATIARLNINLILYVSSAGKTVFGRGFNTQSNQFTFLPVRLQAELQTQKQRLLKHSDVKSNTIGILLLPEAPMIIASRPILTGDGTGPIQGTLVMGRYLDVGEVERLAELTHLSLTTYPLNGSPLPPDAMAAWQTLKYQSGTAKTQQRSPEPPMVVRPLDDERVAGYTLLKDIYGHPAVLVKVDIPREIHAQGQASLRYLLFSLIVVGLGFGATTQLLLEKFVLSRLAHLSHDVERIGAKRDLSMRLVEEGADEISSLAGEVNGMLAALQEAEEKYRSIFENASEGIFQITPDGYYLNANPALAKIYGYDSVAALLHTGISRYQLFVEPGRSTEFVELISTQGTIANFESQIYRPNKEVAWICENARAVKDSQDRLLYYEGTATDITVRRVVEEALRYQQAQADRLLLDILPAPIAERLKLEQSTIADSFAEVTVLFADIVGFTQLSSYTSPIDLVDLLNRIFSAFDKLAERHGLEKIKTIGDAYMVVGGLPLPQPDHAQAIAEMALDMQAAIGEFKTADGTRLSIRIGISTGPVVAGVIGIKKFIYDLWGDTVNIASRMESQGLPGHIQVTEVTYQSLRHTYRLEKRGTIEVKGKGEMATYFLIGKQEKVLESPVLSDLY